MRSHIHCLAVFLMIVWCVFMLSGCAPSMTAASDTSDESTETTSGENGEAPDNDDQSQTEDTGSDQEDEGDGDSSTASTTGAYDPAEALSLSVDGVTLDIPAGAVEESISVTVEEMAYGDLPAELPDEVGFAGATFGPSGQTFSEPVTITVELTQQTPLPVLPVLTYDEDTDMWTGTGRTATVSEDGTSATFTSRHFSILGVPDVPEVPDEGDSVGLAVVLSGDGSLTSNVFNSESGSFMYSQFGTTFELSATSQDISGSGDGGTALSNKSLGLSAVQVFEEGNYVFASIGGGNSIYNTGLENEQAVGVAAMSVSGSDVFVYFFVATPKRAIAGGLVGQQ